MKINKSEKTAEVVGLCYGDGSLTRRPNGKLRFQMRGHVEEKSFYDDHVKPLFESQLGVVQMTSYKGNKPYYGICSERQDLCEALVFLGVPVGRKIELSIPGWIKANRKYLKSFLRGFFDTDGSIYCGKDYNYPDKKHIKLRANFSAGYSNIIDDVYTSLKSLEIHSLQMKPQKLANPKWGNGHRIQIDGPNVLDFLKIIGTMNPKHQSKYKVWRKFGFCPPYTSHEQRQQILNNKLDPESFYARVGEWSNPLA